MVNIPLFKSKFDLKDFKAMNPSLKPGWLTHVKNNLIFTEDRDELLPGVKDLWDTFNPEDMIILTTARPQKFKEQTIQFLNDNQIRFNHIIFDLPRGERVLVNDKKPDIDITAIAINVERDKGF